jgi:hypothetical protein
MISPVEVNPLSTTLFQGNVTSVFKKLVINTSPEVNIGVMAVAISLIPVNHMIIGFVTVLF